MSCFTGRKVDVIVGNVPSRSVAKLLYGIIVKVVIVVM